MMCPDFTLSEDSDARLAAHLWSGSLVPVAQELARLLRLCNKTLCTTEGHTRTTVTLEVMLTFFAPQTS
jgi:hypothetical protein